MRNRYLVVMAVLLFSLSFAAGCATRQLTKATTDRLDAIAAKIAEAERMGAKECAPRELARAKVALDHARHEALEHFENSEEDIREAEAAADDLLAKTKACVEAKKPKEVPPPPPAPTVSLSANPGSIEQGNCSSLSWSSSNATTATIDQGIGTVEASGKKEVCPTSTTSYSILATGPGGSASAMATVTVTAPPPPPPPPPVEKAFKLENIHFDFDKAFIREDAKPILQNVAAYMKKEKNAKILIEGHCDERGTSEYNMALGDRRASSAKKYLIGLGVNGNRVMTISYGKEKPLDPGHDEQAWAKNRRAVFVLK